MKLRPAVLLLTLAFALGASPAPALSGPPLSSYSWLGVTLGEPEAQVLQTQGEAGIGLPADGKGSISYTLDHGKGTLDVAFRHGYVQSIALRKEIFSEAAPTIADPSGIIPGMTRDDVIAKRGAGTSVTPEKGWPYVEYAQPGGVVWRYYTLNNEVRSITLAASDAAIDALPAIDAPKLHGGTSFDDAVLNGAPDESSGARNEYWYVLNLRCLNGGGLFREVQQALDDRGGRKYDVLHLKCYRSDEQRDLYFDITPFFRKLQP